MKKYTFVWDKLTVCITSILILIFLFLIYEGYNMYAHHDDSWGIFVICLALLLLLFPICLCPLYATKRGPTITIHFLLHKKKLNLKAFEVEPQTDFSLKGWFRLAASGGYFGYWGLWTDKKGNVIVSYLTNRKRDVYMLRPSNGKPIVLNLPHEWME